MGVSIKGFHLDVLGLALSDEHAVEVKLFVRELHFWRGHVGLQKDHRLRAVFRLDGYFQGPDSMREALSARQEKASKGLNEMWETLSREARESKKAGG